MSKFVWGLTAGLTILLILICTFAADTGNDKALRAKAEQAAEQEAKIATAISRHETCGGMTVEQVDQAIGPWLYQLVPNNMYETWFLYRTPAKDRKVLGDTLIFEFDKSGMRRCEPAHFHPIIRLQSRKHAQESARLAEAYEKEKIKNKLPSEAP